MLLLVCPLWACSENQIVAPPEKEAEPEDCEAVFVGFLDADGDGYGSERVEACTAPSGVVDQDGDCDDADGGVHPGAEELCDGVDEDCNGVVDDTPVDGVSSYRDEDGDGYGVEPATVVCPSDAVVATADDCDDGDSTVHPGVEDVCDGVDNDCDDLLDEDAPVVTGFEDGDGDGHGDPDRPVETCEDVEVVAAGDDCDDTDEDISPSATEICGNGIDDDCDGGAASCLPSGTLDLATEGTLVAAASGSDYASRDFAAGDVDGDGIADLWVGATGRGRAFLMLGPITADTDLGQAEARLENGTQTGVGMGLGDLDGDGYDDLLVGDIWDGPYDQYAGSAWWLPGPVSGVLQLDDVATGRVSASGYRANLGAELVTCDDMDGDGSAEWAITAVGDNSYAGAVYVFDGAPIGTVGPEDADGVFYGDADVASFGESLTTGDLDGDGLPELIVGGGGDDGRVGIFSGDPTGSFALSDADAFILGNSGDALGVSLASGVDLNGDGQMDLVVGAPRDDASGFDHGSVDVYTGPLSGALSRADATARHHGGNLQEVAGTSVAMVPDLDGDGGGELLVGAPAYSGATYGQGRVYLVLAPASGSTNLNGAQAAWHGRDLTELAGNTLTAAADVTGDGAPDLLVGALQENTSGNDAGAIYILTAGGL